MKINNFYANTVDFFKKHRTRYGCIATVEKMLLSSINEDRLESERIIPVIDNKTQHVSI